MWVSFSSIDPPKQQEVHMRGKEGVGRKEWMKISVRRRGAGVEGKGYKIKLAVMFDLETGSNKKNRKRSWRWHRCSDFSSKRNQTNSNRNGSVKGTVQFWRQF